RARAHRRAVPQPALGRRDRGRAAAAGGGGPRAHRRPGDRAVFDHPRPGRARQTPAAAAAGAHPRGGPGALSRPRRTARLGPAHPEDAPAGRAPRGRARARRRAVPGPGGGGGGTGRRGATRSDAGTAEPPCGARRADQAGRDVAATMLSRSSAAPQISSTTVERVPEAGEEALLAGGELAGRVLLATQLGELPEQLLLLGVEAGGGLD